MSELYRWTTPISMDRRSLREHLAMGSLVLAEPVGTLTVTFHGYEVDTILPDLPPGRYGLFPLEAEES